MSEEAIVDYVAGPRHVQPSRTDGSIEGWFFFSCRCFRDVSHVYVFM